MVVLRSIEPVSLAKVYAVLTAIFGLIYGIIIALLFAALGSLGATSMHLGGAAVVIIGILAIIGIPILSGIFGFILGIIIAVIYNFVASKIGGVQIDLK